MNPPNLESEHAPCYARRGRIETPQHPEGGYDLCLVPHLSSSIAPPCFISRVRINLRST